jgi:phenylpropionate dioxygenase-like ring-hydroxylating dioxygenase large terminal subunit
MSNTLPDSVDSLLQRGLYDLWFPICPSNFVNDRPLSLRRLGRKLALWRDAAGVPHALEDHCPHRGAPLSMGVNLGDRLACPYHGIEVRCDGTVTKVPASPGCTLEGTRAAASFHVQDAYGALWLFNSRQNIDTPPPLVLHRMAHGLPLRHRQCDGSHARHLCAQAITFHERGRHQRQVQAAQNRARLHV